jgi:REP element-mobilizing transposase RayT
MRATQLLLSDEFKESAGHGGSFIVGKRKSMRPINAKVPMHLVLRSSLARGEWSFLRRQNALFIARLVARLSKKHEVKIYEWANAGTHLHLLVKTKTREGLGNFLRALAGQIAQKITGAVRGKPFGKRFWNLLAFSRIAQWGRAFETLRIYIQKNTLEALGLIPYERRSSLHGKKSPAERRKGRVESTELRGAPLEHGATLGQR